MNNLLNATSILEKLRAEEQKPISFYSKKFDGEIPIIQIKLSKFFNLLEGLTKSLTSAEQNQQMTEMIYACCPIFSDSQLQDFYRDEIIEPWDVIDAIYKKDLNEKAALYEAILASYKFDEEYMVDELKN